MGNGRAIAQWDMGFFGWGLGMQTPAVVNYLNDHSIARIGPAAAARPQPLRAPTPVVRDVDFFNKYDAATRAAMTDRVARVKSNPTTPATQTPAQPPASTAQAPRPVTPLLSFFDKMRQLIWPADAPTMGDLATKRSISDAKTLEVLDEVQGHGYAQVATAVEARGKLLDYGRPALQFIQDSSTPAVFDAFHTFLLSLYDSIGAAPQPTGR
jgi:hypothetical protein